MKKDFTRTKVVTQMQLAKLVRHYKKEGKTVGCLSGSFDVLTARHYKSLHECTNFCDVLIVLLNSDESVRGYKGPGKPIMVESERAYLVAQSTSVAHIVLFDELTPLTVLKKIQPNIYFNTTEWGSECIEKVTVEKYGGTIKAFDITIDAQWTSSTSALIQRIVASESLKSRKAVFLDRDGVINYNGAGYIHKWEDFKFLPKVISVLKKLGKAGYLLFIITNQSGVGRGYYTEKDVKKLHREITVYLKKKGVTITGIYYCPHRPDEGCSCRKPSPSMLIQASLEHGINLSKSWIIGDSGSDIDAGRYANVQTILIGSEKNEKGLFKPRASVKNIEQAGEVITSTK